ncbi:uncharacterized protein LOC111392707 [Olea europaea var. sylvestris]|uniref:uncharacterized protein LOC111392707 n=1 Tax=Olea europaea var. sylvestris TaxID=158386 RepID=UPI000C1D5589|nr:uncharacterized protein LOC111392707 [Olea europaea var. sylvestris]
MVEMVNEFDPIMHIWRAKAREIQYTYLGKKIQNELIQLLANEVDDITRLGLATELQKALIKLDLDIDKIRGQVYDDGSNMSGKHKDVQRRIRDALLDLAESNKDPKVKSEVESLAIHELQNIEFLLGIVIWYRLLHAINNRIRGATFSNLLNSCMNLDKYLEHDGCLNINGDDLCSKLQVLRCYLQSEATRAIEVLQYLKRLNVYFSNAYIAYKILLIIPVTVTSIEKGFSKLKLIKTYLRSTMSQERLNGLTMLSIEKEMVKQLNYSDLIDIFASIIAR